MSFSQAAGSVHIDPLSPESAPYAGWSPSPGKIPVIQSPTMKGPICPLLPLSCGSCATGKCVVPAQQPVVPVPVYQEIQRRDRIIEVPQTVITDKIIPKLFRQEVFYDVPKIAVEYKTVPIKIPRIEFREKIIDVPVPVGFNYKVVSKWEIREVPKVIPKYVGKQEEIYVEVPQVKIVDKNIEKEVPVYVGEKVVRKRVIQEEPVDVIEYQYVETYEDVPVYKYKPVFDVESEVQLDPERISLAQWKQLRLGAASGCCNDHAGCGPNPINPCMCQCSKCCHPGGLFSPAGFCGSTCCVCQGVGCSECCQADTGATGQFEGTVPSISLMRGV